jgi:hypothetical protein
VVFRVADGLTGCLILQEQELPYRPFGEHQTGVSFKLFPPHYSLKSAASLHHS